jgi:hypothetical protein
MNNFILTPEGGDRYSKEQQRRSRLNAVVMALGVALALAAILVVLTALAQPAEGATKGATKGTLQGTLVRAQTADSFVQSIGIDTHIKNLSTPYGNYAALKAHLQELGVKHARDAAVVPSNRKVYERYRDLCNSLGIKYTLNVNAHLWAKPPTATQIEQIVGQGGCAVEMFEGPNEYNNNHTYDGWGADLEEFQRGTFNAINTSNHPEIPLLAAPLGKPSGDYPPLSEIPDLAQESDANSTHSYPGGNHPTGSHRPEYDSLLFDRDIPMAEYVGAPGRDLYATETGYSTANFINGVSEEAHAHYAPRISFEYFNAGIKRGFHYQLLDHLKLGATDPQSHFGLIAYDGRKKSVFRALENTIDILEEPGSSAGFTPGSLEYTLSGGDANVHTTLLQKRDGTFYLALWQEVRSYDKQTDQMISVTPQKVTVQFSSAMKSVRVFDPTNIASSGPTDDAESHPSRTLSSVSSVTEPIGDQVKIIEVSKP